MRALIGIAVVVLFTGVAAAAAPPKPYALWTGTNVYVSTDGRAWHRVTPRGAVPPRTPALIDDFSFQDSRHAWLIASDCATAKGSLYRTSDGGKSWTRRSFYSHSCSGGANFSLSVLSGTTAWVVQNEPSAAAATLAKTINGGRSWRVVRNRLPDLGKITFVDASRGWLAGLSLHRTDDGGKTWARVVLPPPRGFAGRLAFLSRVTFFGSRGFVAAEYEHGRHVIGFYRTDDAGRSWHLLATLAGSGPAPFPQFAISALSPTTVWLFTAGAAPAVSVSRDGGRHWTTHLLGLKLFAPVALSARVAAASDYRGTPMITHDGGLTCGRLLL